MQPNTACSSSEPDKNLEFSATASFSQPATSHIEFLTHPTRDQILEYLRLRKLSFDTDRNMEGHFNHGQLDFHDLGPNVHVIVIQENGKIVGGTRISISHPDLRIPLPTEEGGVNYAELFPQYDIENSCYAEIHRFVVDPTHRNQKLSNRLSLRAYIRCIELDADYFFVPAVPARARMYQKITRELGGEMKLLKNYTLRMDKFDNVEMQLLHLDIKNQQPYKTFRALADSGELENWITRNLCDTSRD